MGVQLVDAQLIVLDQRDRQIVHKSGRRYTRPPIPLSHQVNILDNGCWEWIGAKANGYGYINRHGKVMPAHVWIYELCFGEYQDGLVLHHKCKSRSCVNPYHLEPRTQRDNILAGDSMSAINAKRTHCIHGHEFTIYNTYIAPSGYRMCMTCKRRRGKEWREREKHGNSN